MSTARKMARASARKDRAKKPKQVRIPLKKETALQLTRLQAEFEITMQRANEAVARCGFGFFATGHP